MAKGKLYRSPNGKFMGVCAGLSNWLRVDVSLIRIAFVIGLFMTGGTLIVIYIALGIFLPIDDYDDSESVFSRMKDEFSNDMNRGSSKYRKEYRSSKKGRPFTVSDVKDEFDNLKSRVSKMEDSVFNKEKDWDERFNKSK